MPAQPDPLTRRQANERITTIPAEKTAKILELKKVIEKVWMQVKEKLMPDPLFMLIHALGESQVQDLNFIQKHTLKEYFKWLGTGLDYDDLLDEIHFMEHGSDGQVQMKNLQQLLRSFATGSVEVERLYSHQTLIVEPTRSSMTTSRRRALLGLSFNRQLNKYSALKNIVSVVFCPTYLFLNDFQKKRIEEEK